MKDQVKKYGKYGAVALTAAGLGAGAGVTQTDSGDTAKVADLKEKVESLEQDKESLEGQVDTLQSTLADKGDRVEDLKSTVRQLQNSKEDLASELADVRDREHVLDYVPVFDNSDVELENVTTVERDSHYDEGEYDRVDMTFTDEDEGHVYRVDVRKFEYGEDAEDYFDDEQETADDNLHMDAYRDGDVVVVVEGVESSTGDENDFEYSYARLQNQY